MAFSLTDPARLAAAKRNILPNLVLEIDGVPTKYGAVRIQKYIRIGDPGLLIDGTWKIGGLRELEDQLDAISFDGSTSMVNQQLQPDKGSGGSISNMAIVMVDVNQLITQLISPGLVVDDILARKATVWLGFSDVGFPEDYIRIFKGIIDDVNSDSGAITLNIAHPDQKKRQQLFLKAETELSLSIDAVQTTIDLVDGSNFLTTITGPNLSVDPSFETMIRIGDELIKYTGRTGNQLTGCTRGYLFTAAAAHGSGDTVESFYRLTGNCLDLAQKIMLSGWNDYFKTGQTCSNFNIISPTENVPNSIFFFADDVPENLGLTVGDYVTSAGATNPANNFTLKPITAVNKTNEGFYIVIGGVTLADEPATAALLSFRSQYDTLPNGLKMSPDEVDVAEHKRLQRLFLSSFSYDFYIRDTIEAKDFIEQEIYFPAAAYSLPRKARSSVGYHVGPLPSVDIKTISDVNTAKPSQLKLRRTINKNFYNTIIYKFNEDALSGEFRKGHVEVSAESKARVNIETKALIVKSKGMRHTLNAVNLSSSAAKRRLKRYKFGAEHFDTVEVFYGFAYNVEIGDIIVFDNERLNVSNTRTGQRGGEPKLFEVINKSFDVKVGMVKLSLVDTNQNLDSRYFSMSPSSRIETGTSTTQFKIRPTGNSPFGSDEGRKWSRYLQPGKLLRVRVRSNDFTTRNAVTTITQILGNVITVSPALPFTPLPEDTMTLAHYNEMTDSLKLVYGWMRNTDPFDDGKKRYQMMG